MIKVAIISDIHANLEALQAVLKDIEDQGIQDVISLGDNVGYGPNPAEVLEILYSKNILSLEGNHDLAVVNPKSFEKASGHAFNAIEWTRAQLSAKVKEDEGFQDIIAQYFGTPAFSLLQENHKVLLVHGSPGKHKFRFNYLIAPEDFLEPTKYMKKMKYDICFFGHTHRQILWETDAKGVSIVEYDINEELEYTDEELKKIFLFVNPGSVGQPRDSNPKAAYAIYEKRNDTNIITFKRVEYDIDSTIEKIYMEDYLPNVLGDRLFKRQIEQSKREI